MQRDRGNYDEKSWYWLRQARPGSACNGHYDRSDPRVPALAGFICFAFSCLLQNFTFYPVLSYIKPTYL